MRGCQEISSFVNQICGPETLSTGVNPKNAVAQQIHKSAFVFGRNESISTGLSKRRQAWHLPAVVGHSLRRHSLLLRVEGESTVALSLGISPFPICARKT